MGVFDWLRGLFGRGDDSEPDAPTGSGTHRCTVCGTTTDGTECPLCHGSDLVPVGTGEPPHDADADRPPAATETSQPDTTVDAARQLRELRRRREEQ